MVGDDHRKARDVDHGERGGARDLSAYNKSRRRELHRRAAQTITEKFPAVAEAQPETLARHWTYSGDTEPAIAAWKKAGEAAEARRAFREAEEGYRQALAVLKTLPESPERDARELELAGALYRAFLITKGYSATETLEAAGRSRALAEKGGNLAQLVLQAFASFGAFVVWGDYASASALADQILDLAQREGSYTSLGFAHAAQVYVRFFRGDLVGVEEHFTCLSSFVEAACFTQFPGALANTLGFASLSAWMLGHADSARARIAQAIALARDDKNGFDPCAIKPLPARRRPGSDLRLVHRGVRHGRLEGREDIARRVVVKSWSE
jgi:tetratricopeptide (TPR) repeat protein